MTPESQNYLKERIKELPFVVESTQVQKLIAHMDLLNRWNKVFNLTAIREEKDQIDKHLLDSLAILPFLGADKLLDIGSGAGFPGIPIGIIKPQMSIMLVEKCQKKTRFLLQAIYEFKLSNIVVFSERVEKLEGKFPQIVSRAFSSLSQFFLLAQSHLTEDGKVYAMKGKINSLELEDPRVKSRILWVKKLPIFEKELGERHLIAMS